VRLVPPDSKPIEDLDPLCAGALRRFIRAQSQVPALPVEVSLRSVTRIVLTGDRAAAPALARALIAQLAVSHSPADVRISVCAPADRIQRWEWVKWLPHSRHPTEQDAAGPVRLMSPSLGGLAPMLGLRDRPRFPAPTARDASGPGSLPLHVVVTDGAAREPGVDLAGIDGVVVIDLGPDGGEQTAGPGTLTLDVAWDAVHRVSRDGSADAYIGQPDLLSRPEAEALARQLAPLRPADAGGPADDALAADTTLTDLLGATSLRELDVARVRRGRAPRDRLRVPIGVDADGQPVELDLKESAEGGMGPHGLVVGATGSGKSELLRTLVLGLALTHSAQDLNFVLVDFKGGATFLGLDRLPHTSAVITNLADELPLVDRMRDALQGEVVRRQELLRAAGNFASLRDYSAARAQGGDQSAVLPPVPSLFVVLDEFSELLAAKPELIDLFVTIGRVGRSLGVHLLLASQRLEEGRLRGLDTQLSYRIGLRTFSAPESRIVLGVPDAYELPSRPGHAYLRADTSELIRFKAAYSSGPVAGAGSPADQPGGRPGPRVKPRVAHFGPGYVAPRFEEAPVATEAAGSDEAHVVGGAEAHGPRETGQTLLDAVVDQLCGPGPAAHRIWLPPLDEPPTLDQLLDQSGRAEQPALQAVLGIVDRPFEQRREPLRVDLAGSAGHVAVAGAPRSGKSTVLLSLIGSLALTHSPAQAQLYLLDFGGGSLGTLAGLPHVGGVASRLQGDRVRRTVAELRTLLEQREREFSERGIDSIATYRALRADGAIAGDGFGDVFLVVDGWLTLRQDYEELEQAVTALAARGLGYGIHLVAATNKWSEFRPAVRDLFGTRLELRLGDPYESEIGRAAARNVPSSAPGRGLTRDGLHFLAAMPRVDGRTTAAGLPEAIRELVAQAAAAWPGSAAPPVRMLPDVLPAAGLPSPAATGSRVPFGIDENALAPVFLDFGTDPHFLVLGDTECGKSNLLRLVTAGIAARFTPDQAKIIFLDYRRALLESAQVPHQIGYATSSVAATTLLDEVRGALSTRLPPPDLTPDQLRSRSWWHGSDLFVIVDDYDLVAGSANPLLPLAEFLPQARDVGLHVILARSAGGAGRAMFDPVIQRLREMGSPGLIMSGSKDEGALLAGVRAAPQPCGRGFLVTRRHGSRLVQVAVAADADADEEPNPDDHPSGQYPVIA
jgi:S-DNA-T family DNA segregation ATPase FtsK/SpoIIIE